MTKFVRSWILDSNGRAIADFFYQEALKYARQTYKRHNELKPIIFSVDAAAVQARVMLPGFQEGFSRTVLSEVLRHALDKANSVAYCFLMEMWIRSPSTPEEVAKAKALLEQGHSYGTSAELSSLTDSYPRREILAFNIAAPGIKEFKMLSVVRDKNERVKSLDEADNDFMAVSDSWLLNLLDTKQTVH